RVQSLDEPPRLALVELEPVLNAVAMTLDPAPDVTVRVECPEGLAVATDADLLEQALSTVAANAAKFTMDGGIVLRADRELEHVQIVVSDTGVGIPEEDQSRILERFYRGVPRHRGGGAGLGLAIARQAVEALGGILELESEPLIGTTVRLHLNHAL